ncbi:hypothetical protein TRICHSKD4_3029 [Roseibium sp. TrichSKD4]|uniref:hypothetical protein n=1 Tax=Roseibium sp. TrichSKD4 TaxID=744980 RepID=UPI0001E56A92|nr:hypothetical protein [Roseibium sp. TrichSKD4]EFO31934.1 hypothetical protein TRICHSKD4_3029 [Roseibium sp. TrichSKD4]
MEIHKSKHEVQFYQPQVQNVRKTESSTANAPENAESFLDSHLLRSPIELGLGYIDLPPLSELRSQIEDLQLLFAEGEIVLEPEINEPLKVILREELSKIDAIKELQLRK